MSDDRFARYRRKLSAEFRAFIESLGPCVDCGTTEQIEPDHIEPRTWQARKVSRRRRIDLYKRDHAAGIIVARCRSCNAKRGAPDYIPDERDAEWTAEAEHVF